MLRKPNLFIIGAMKSGTTYLAKVLNLHPSIFICNPEEPSYFVDPQQLRRLWPYMQEHGYWRSQEHYLSLFEGARSEKILGEASTNYTKRPLIMGIPEKIWQFNSDARFIYIMRDPIERTISHYWHAVRNDAERRSLLDAIKQDPHYRDVSYYAMQLMPFFERFGRDKFKILTLEELADCRKSTIKSLFSWLNVDSSFVSPGFAQPDNVTPQLLSVTAHFAKVERWLLQTRLGRLVNSHIPFPIRYFGAKLIKKSIDRRAINTSEVIKFLRPIQQKQTEELARMLGRQFTEWRTLYSQYVHDSFEAVKY